jgi:hypothetical protein
MTEENVTQQVDVSDVDDSAIDFIFSDEERERQRMARRPAVEHLDLATSETKLTKVALFDVGQRVVVERMSTLMGGNEVRWLDTKVYHVKSLDRETGAVKATEEETDHWSNLNFMSEKQVFRIAPPWPKNPFVDKRRRRQSKQMKEFHDRLRGDGGR